MANDGHTSGLSPSRNGRERVTRIQVDSYAKMTTFVPLSQDTEGAVSSAALGDWILSIIKVRAPAKTADYYSKLLNQFQEVDGEQIIKDSFQLFELLLSEHDMLFAFLQDAKDKGTTAVLTIDQNSKVETEVGSSTVL